MDEAEIIDTALEAWASFLERPGAWCQMDGGLWEARDIDGQPCDHRSERAVSWCLMGALDKLRLPWDAYSRVARRIDPTDLAAWNDAAGRGQHEVVELVRGAKVVVGAT